jgi:pilus assembly protein CpaB
MLARIALFALMAIGLVGFGVVAWVSLHPAGAPPQADATVANDKVAILVAARPLRAGTLLKPDDLGVESRSDKDVPAGAKTDTPSARADLLGAMVRRNLAKGEVVLDADALNPGDRGFLAAVLGSGMRAVTVGVDAVSGLSGLVWPGDRVDLILTQTQEGTAIPPARRVSGETVLSNARVIAIDRQIMQGATSESPQSQAVRTVTLEVTPSDAERVAVASRLGQLSLSIVAVAPPTGTTAASGSRDLDPVSSQAGNGVTWGGDVSSALRGGPTTPGATVRLFQGPSDSKEIHF